VRARFHLLALRVFGLLPRGLRSRIVRLLYPTFTVGTAVAISDGAGRVLLVQQSYSDGWSLPGGLLSGHEQPLDTARREIREELGLDLDLGGHPLAVRTLWRRHFNFLFSTTIEPIDAASLQGHTPEISDADWFALDALPHLAEFTDHLLEAAGLLPSATAIEMDEIDGSGP